MPYSSTRLALFTLLVWTAAAPAQYAPPAYNLLPPPPPPLAPLFYVRFSGPPETKITVYRGFDKGQTLELPCTLGFRPGYAYRFAVTDVPRFPRQMFFPTLEVRGTLALSPRMRSADFPANVKFSEEDFFKANFGSFIKKAIILERPDEAIPVQSKKDNPLEILVPGGRDPVVAGNERGQPIAVLHLGQRFSTPEELNAFAVPGTVLLPGSRILGTPRLPPPLSWNWCQVYDPLYGPKHPAEYSTLYDGGDVGNQAGFNRAGKLKGLDPSDTVAEYKDSQGKKQLAVSNRIGLCVPRFLVFKSELVAAAQVGRFALENSLGQRSPGNVNGQVALKGEIQEQRAEDVLSTVRPSGAFTMLGTAVTGRMVGMEVKTTLRATESIEAIKISPPRLAPDGPLMIIKWPDKMAALVGEVVTMFLKYTNTGGQPITDVVVSDSLTARFEYVKGSAKSDRDAIFTVQPNEVGSEVLRWQIGGALQPRDSGIISFQVRIR